MTNVPELEQLLRDMQKAETEKREQEAYAAAVYTEGFNAGVTRAIDLIHKQEMASTPVEPPSSAVNSFIYELYKELDIHGQDI